MKANDKAAFTQFMLGIAELYEKKLSVQKIEIYWRMLACYPLQAIQAAIEKHGVNPDNGQFMPKPADIVRFLQGTTEHQALYAWGKVTQAIRDVGGYMSIIFDDPLIHLVISEMGGWIKLCESQEKTLVFLGQEFQKRYRGHVGHQALPYPCQLTGIIEHVNQASGQRQASTILYGNTESAMQVFRQGISPNKFHPQSIELFPQPAGISNFLHQPVQAEIENLNEAMAFSQGELSCN